MSVAPVKSSQIILIGLFAIIATGCASVMEGGDQVINISTTGCEDQGTITCTASNDDGSSVLTPPASVSVDKDKDALTVSCSSENGLATGETIVDSKYEAWNAGNILIGGIIGIGVDAATGAMWKYPSAIVVPMKCDIGTPDESTDSAADDGDSAPQPEVAEPGSSGLPDDSANMDSVKAIAAEQGCLEEILLLSDADSASEVFEISCENDTVLTVRCADNLCAIDPK